MTQPLLSLCRTLGMPFSVTEEILSLSTQLPFPVLQPAMDMLFFETTWETGLSQLKKQLKADPRGMKMLTCMLVCALKTRENYRKLGISEDIFLATMGCFPRFVREHQQSYGCYGFDRDFWTVRQLSAVLFRIGLLEYELEDRKISLHIPSGAHLIPEQIDISLAQARDFLAHFFPDWKDHPMCCHSWLLSPALSMLLPEDSNILRFQKRFQITPAKAPNQESLVWIYKKANIPYEQLPENTHLQRALKQYLLDGGVFPEGQGILR